MSNIKNLDHVSYFNLHQKSGKCIICGKNAEIQKTFINRETGVKTHCYWDICEECKKIKNCFTCRFSKCWYLRYKGVCDVNFNYLIISSFFLEEKEVTAEDKELFRNLLEKNNLEVKDKNIKIAEFLEIIDNSNNISKEGKLEFHNLFGKYNQLLYAIKKKDKKAFNDVLKRYNLENIDLYTTIFDFLDMIKQKSILKLEGSLPDCRLYKTKKIGDTIGSFWNERRCKRYMKGDASKKEYDDYNADFYWEDEEYYENDYELEY